MDELRSIVSEPVSSGVEGAAFGQPTYIVGIGASAGGLEALERLFHQMPADTGMAFVVVQHLSPDFDSVMDELLARHTRIPIHTVEDGMELRGNAIYLIPPKKEVIVSGGKLLLAERDPTESLSLPINTFFRSLAQEAGPSAIAIVLSGTGSDGSRGVRNIHDAGGLVIAQSEETAKFDGMPKSAVETGAVDLVLSPDAMAEALAKFARHPVRGDLAAQAKAAPVDEGAMNKLMRLLHEATGIDFSLYKPSTVLRRIERRLVLNQSDDLDGYVAQVGSEPDELNSLYRDLLIGVTQFFRDGDAFRVLESQVLPELVSKASPEDGIRIWVPACATGEEAYSLAIGVHELFAKTKRLMPVKIFATDVHKTSLDCASAGVYDQSNLTDVSEERLKRYFTRKGEQYQVVPELRQMIVFAPHNVIKDAPFTRIDLISCRNLLIYFQPPGQKKAVSLFHFALKTGGVLFLGPSENVGDLEDEFAPVDRHWKIYRKRRNVRFPPDMRLPLTSVPHLHVARGVLPGHAAGGDADLSAAYDQLLARYVPPAVLLNSRREVVHVFGGATEFLHFKPGRATADALDLVGPEVKTAVSGAIQKASKELAPVAYSGVRIDTPHGPRQFKLGVVPLLDRNQSLTHLLVTFDSVQAPSAAMEQPEAEPVDMEDVSRQRIDTLESELRYTKENLQATIEELETSNEELHATNEELVASNEELQSTNEELHSVNEELYSVNAEYQRKVSELTEMTDDMQNLLASTDIGVLFLDDNLCIRKFTPRISSLFNVIEQDVGRSFENFTHNIDHAGLIEDVQRVLHSGAAVEREVRDRFKHWYLLRILPYRAKSEVDGVVVTLIDITKQKRAHRRASKAVEHRDRFLATLSHELRNPLAAIRSATQLLRRTRCENNAAERIAQVVGRQTEQMARLLDDLLDVSRFTRDKFNLRKELVDLRLASEDAVMAVRSTMAERGVELHVELPEQPVYVYGDLARLQQVQVNLLFNAAKFTPSGGSVRLALAIVGEKAVIRVADNGIGMSRELLRQIFEPFFQGPAAAEERNPGMGLGLTLVRSLVEMHGGTVLAASAGPGKGSSFNVELPLSRERAEHHAPRAGGENADRTRTTNLRILIVEDNSDTRDMMKMLLESYGYEIVTAGDGRSALELLEAERPDVALVDIGLPEMDGYEVARRARRKRPDGSGAYLVALTGYGRPADRKKAQEAGFDDHLTKPVDMDVLWKVLEAAGRRRDHDRD